MPGTQTYLSFTSVVLLEHNELKPLTFVKDQTCLERAGEPPTGRASEDTLRRRGGNVSECWEEVLIINRHRE